MTKATACAPSADALARYLTALGITAPPPFWKVVWVMRAGRTFEEAVEVVPMRDALRAVLRGDHRDHDGGMTP